jgi:NADPH2:quinone reductase
MRAVWYSDFGSAEEVLEVGETATPHAGPGEVRVRLHASGVNPVDVKRRAGGRGAIAAAQVIPHSDGAGVIDEVGEGVGPARIGQRVWVYEGQVQRHSGTAAEFVAIDHRRVVPLPEGASFNDGACLGIPALTAHRCVFADGSVAGQTILVTGGAGAVGHYAVQFAALDGARVISTVSGPEKARHATAAGASEVLNYREESVVERVLELTDGKGVDRVVEVEFGGNLTDALGATRIGAVIATYASQAEPEPQIPFYQLLYRNLTVRFELVFMMPEEAKSLAVSDITRWLDEGRLHHNVAEVFPLEQAVAAHQAVEAGPLGKVILDVGPQA